MQLFRGGKRAADLTLIRPLVSSSSNNTSQSSAFPQRSKMSTSVPPFASVGVRNTIINEASGVQLSDRQKLLVGSVLDLFEGRPTLKHLSLWHRDATFTDPLTIAKGFDRYAAQWYGLPAVFDPIKLVSHQVVSAGNPIEVDLRNIYTVKLLKKEQEITSRVRIYVGDDGKIERVEDRWNDKLPEGAISEVRLAAGASSISREEIRADRDNFALLAVLLRLCFWPLDLALWMLGVGIARAWSLFCWAAWQSPFMVWCRALRCCFSSFHI
ncbi:hypothetical protein B0H63DRAFT_485437 [Podospora didyma]|uniref:Uncharacterized protein n=1 Tax=Podospora didyma TaxID=330526 RepID=A0AAE0KB48_9PEZI|nr:hypothetical protein B0H63DRAFT_485437 [Podospora didyma]